MDDSLKAQVRQSMREKETEHLLELWTRTDNDELTDAAREIVRETLLERGVTPPEPLDVMDVAPEDDDDGPDVYHNHNRLMNVASWASSLSWLFLGLAVISFFLALYIFIGRFMLNNSSDFAVLLLQLVSYMGTAMVNGLLFIVSQLVGQGIYLLMDIEDNTRKPAAGKS